MRMRSKYIDSEQRHCMWTCVVDLLPGGKETSQTSTCFALNIGMMDIDNDLDGKLLQQFSAMGTTDREVLIAEFQKFLGNTINPDSCAFFLDMNNWWVNKSESISDIQRVLLFQCTP